jgi:Macrocin-O-methyltransferase (TylF)
VSDASLLHEPERLQREVLEKLYESTDLSTFEMFRSFPVFTPRFNLARFLAHYEFFRKIVEVPGVIIDLGVFRGASAFTWAKFCEIFCPTDIWKIVYGFDTFQGFPAVSKEDGPVSSKHGRRKGGYFGGKSVERDLMLAQEAMNHDRHLRHIDRIRFIKGDVAKTVPKLIAEKGNGLKVALLHLDLDIYKPTKVALEHFVPRMTRGGIIVLDEYASTVFGGETKAVDDYFIETFGKRPQIQKLTWHSNPSGYIEVDW